jgi:hypothetical protein
MLIKPFAPLVAKRFFIRYTISSTYFILFVDVYDLTDYDSCYDGGDIYYCYY